MDPAKQEQRRQKLKLRAVFRRIGFEQIPSDGIEFTFDGRTGEVDDIFRQENIVLICEYTVGRATTEHVAKKDLLFSKILKKSAEWVDTYSSDNPKFKASIEGSSYESREIRVRIVYVSTEGVSQEIEQALPHIHFFDGTRLRYFESLSQTIHKSARHEFFKYLRLEYSEIGMQIHNPKDTSRTFDGHLLPEAHSGYPSGFKVVSFYADPETLLALSYVLRQDSWRDADGLYQRILIKSKIARMRKYLVTEKRVFVNNIIVTLPGNTALTDPDTGATVDIAALSRTTLISVGIPYSANMIGLVDGQHRIFCYYEGSDPLETKIASLRKRQNLLVTGLVFPGAWATSKRREFEAKLFLEINDNQARAKSALKQSIELILNPFSTIAIAKEVTNQLAAKGVLADLLQVSFFDPPEKIKTTSIVSYGLRPLLKLEGTDSLFATWTHSDKSRLSTGSATVADRQELLAAYIKYSVDRINTFLWAAKMKTGPEKWKLAKKARAQFLTPTVINGFFVCLRRLAETSKLSSRDKYESSMAGIENFQFSRYKSSGWKALGDKLYDEYFS